MAAGSRLDVQEHRRKCWEEFQAAVAEAVEAGRYDLCRGIVERARGRAGDQEAELARRELWRFILARQAERQ